jgi:hypothetical protein
MNAFEGFGNIHVMISINLTVIEQNLLKITKEVSNVQQISLLRIWSTHQLGEITELHWELYSSCRRAHIGGMSPQTVKMVWFGSAQLSRSCDMAMVAEINFTVCHLIFPPWYCLFCSVRHRSSTEAGFLNKNGTSVLRVFLLESKSPLLTDFTPSPPFEQKWFEAGL